MSGSMNPHVLSVLVGTRATSTISVVECVTDPITTFDVLTELHDQAETLALHPLGDAHVIVALISEVAKRYLSLLIEESEYESRGGES